MKSLALFFLVRSLFVGREYAEDDDDGGGTCVSEADCDNHGECVNGLCKCEDKYAGAFCEDKRKNLIVALLLFIFLGSYGAGDFYTGYTTIAIVKLVFTLFSMFVPIIGWILSIAIWPTIFIWNLVYIIQFATDSRQDADEYSLYS